MMAETIDDLWEARVAVESDVARLRKGDPEALGALLERYQNRLYRYLLRMVREPATAEDLFQQTWLRVAEQVRRYDPRRNFEPWLFTVARNLAIDFLRRYRPESLDEPLPSHDGAAGGAATTLPSRAESIASEGQSALDRVLLEERAAQLADAMQTLPAVYREVLTLRFEEEMKLEEIAEVLAAPLSTVKTRLRRGLEGLRKNLEAQGPPGDWRWQT